MSKIKQLTLPSQEYLQECFEYDSETGNLTWKERPISHFNSEFISKKWNGRFSGKETGTTDKKGYHQVKICGIFYKKHRIIWKLVTSDDPIGYEIDHINLIKSDNRFENLRLCSGSQNCHNQYKRNTNTSGHKGVIFDKLSNKWRASFMFENKHVHVGRYDSIDDAVYALSKTRELIHKEFSNHGEKLRPYDIHP